MSDETKRGFIDLAEPRIIVIRQGSRTYKFTVAPITEARWFKYFDGITSTAERERDTVVQRVDATTPALELADAVIQFGDSKTLAHRLAVANVLTSAVAVEDEGIDAENHRAGMEVVRIHAVWSAEDGDKMRRFKNLLHYFESPTAEQFRRFKREDSRAQIINGSRKGTTVYHGAQRILAQLYDELIVSVAGYAAKGVALVDKDSIVNHMDTYHKVAAAVQLFAPAQVDIEDEIDEDE